VIEIGIAIGYAARMRGTPRGVLFFLALASGGFACESLLDAGAYKIDDGAAAATTTSSIASGSGSSAVTTTATTTTSSSGAGGMGGAMTTGSSVASSSGNGGTGGALVVTPMTVTLLAQTTLTFSANKPNVTWKVLDMGGGSVSTSGAYTAPFAEGKYHLQAALADNPGVHSEAIISVIRTAQPVVLSGPDTIASATGNGSQTHLIYATGTAEWWLFNDSGAMGSLATAHSKDFVTWEPGESAMLPHGHSQDGRDLSVAYRNVGGHDVVHVSQGYDNGTLGRYHIRGAITAGQVAFGSVIEVNSGGQSKPDGTSAIIMPKGEVIDATGYEHTPGTFPLDPCGWDDAETFMANAKEDGTTSFNDVTFSRTVLWCVQSHVNARQLLAVGDTVIYLYEDGEDDAAPMNVLMSVRRSDGVWLPIQQGKPAIPPPRVFSPDMAFGLNDWTGTVAKGQVHAVRRLGSTFEHRMLPDPMGSWTSGQPIPVQATRPDSGLFLAPYGDGLVLFALGQNNGDTVLYSAFDGTQWSSWVTFTNQAADRNFLAGYAPDSGAKPAVIWTQTDGANFDIAGALLP
jgi:hypothetical protein